MVEIKPEEIAPAVEAVENALREERSTFTIGEAEIPATEQTRTATTISPPSWRQRTMAPRTRGSRRRSRRNAISCRCATISKT
jgi:hypothetical protein